MSPYIWIPPYVWMPPVCLDGPICLDSPHICLNAPLYVWISPMFGHAYMFGCPLYVWVMFGCPLYIHNTKKACFVRLRGCPYAPYIWIPPICLDAPCMFEWPHMFGQPPHMFGCSPACLDIPHVWACLYVWMPPECLGDVWMPPVHT